jgi:hypothetical protein
MNNLGVYLKFNMSIKKRNIDLDREKKFRTIKKKSAIDKHKNLIYNIASSKKIDDDNGELDYDYSTVLKIKRR